METPLTKTGLSLAWLLAVSCAFNVPVAVAAVQPQDPPPASWNPADPADPNSETSLFDDMLVENAVQDATPASSADKSAFGAVKFNVKLWEDGVLPVEFASGTTPEQKALFMDACSAWSAVAKVRCIEGSYKGRHLYVMHANLGCWSLWGMGFHFLLLRRMMNLQPSGCWHRSTILHELGHAFGLIHEHQRSDRDKYVEIHRENADGSPLGLNILVNFNLQGAKLLTPYDFTSIMHYDRTAFSKNGLDTIVPRPPYTDMIDVIGRVGTISPLDAQAMVDLYGPAR